MGHDIIKYYIVPYLLSMAIPKEIPFTYLYLSYHVKFHFQEMSTPTVTWQINKVMCAQVEVHFATWTWPPTPFLPPQHILPSLTVCLLVLTPHAHCNDHTAHNIDHHIRHDIDHHAPHQLLWPLYPHCLPTTTWRGKRHKRWWQVCLLLSPKLLLMMRGRMTPHQPLFLPPWFLWHQQWGSMTSTCCSFYLI